jgi:tripartite-type tricarboxylate transporter receptor subunit TctC
MRKSPFGAMLGVAAPVVAADSAIAQSSGAPSQPIELVVPRAVGGAADSFARVIAQVIAEEKLIPVSVEVANRSSRLKARREPRS